MDCTLSVEALGVCSCVPFRCVIYADRSGFIFLSQRASRQHKACEFYRIPEKKALTPVVFLNGHGLKKYLQLWLLLSQWRDLPERNTSGWRRKTKPDLFRFKSFASRRAVFKVLVLNCIWHKELNRTRKDWALVNMVFNVHRNHKAY